MATTVATEVSNAYSTPVVLTPVGMLGGRVRVACGTIACAAADIDADGDIVILARLPLNARVISIAIGSDALDSGTDTAPNVGIYEGGTTATATGTVIDEDYFASAVALGQSAAGTQLTEVITEALDTDVIDGFGERLWEAAVDTQGDFPTYDICLTMTAAASGAAAGDICYRIFYTID